VFSGNNDFILHYFGDITLFTLHVTANCELEKSFNFEKTVEIESHVC